MALRKDRVSSPDSQAEVKGEGRGEATGFRLYEQRQAQDHSGLILGDILALTVGHGPPTFAPGGEDC